MRTLLVTLALVVVLHSTTSEARHVRYLRDVTDAERDVSAADKPDSRDHHTNEHIQEELEPTPHSKEQINERDQHKVEHIKESSKREQKHNHSKEDKKHGRSHQREKEHKNSKEDRHDDSKEKDSSSSESYELSGDELIGIIAIFVVPASHRARMAAQELPPRYASTSTL